MDYSLFCKARARGNVWSRLRSRQGSEIALNMMAETISIIIPTYHSETLGDTLHAIVDQRTFDQVCEIIVAGQQDMADLDNLPKVTFIPVAERPSPAHNRNVGAMQSRGDWLCFTDSDCVPEPDWIEQLARACAAGAVAVGGAVAVPSGMTYWGWCDNLLAFENLLAGVASAQQLDFAATLNFCVRRDLFMCLNGFDESFDGAAGEDRDFCWRLYQAGHSIAFAPGAVVWHHHPRRDFSSAWQHLYRYGEATSQFRFKQGGSITWRMGRLLARLRLIGELAGLARVALRAIARPLRRPRLLRYGWALPGMALLDWAHTLGMIRAIRSHAT